MPLFMDVHYSLPEGATAGDLAEAHKADLQPQDRCGVHYVNYDGANRRPHDDDRCCLYAGGRARVIVVPGDI